MVGIISFGHWGGENHTKSSHLWASAAVMKPDETALWAAKFGFLFIFSFSYVGIIRRPVTFPFGLVLRRLCQAGVRHFPAAFQSRVRVTPAPAARVPPTRCVCLIERHKSRTISESLASKPSSRLRSPPSTLSVP